MKFKTFMPVLALACVCAVGQADAAQDRLMMPEQPAEPLNVIEAEVAIPVPSEEVRDVVDAFTQFQLDQKGKRIMDDSRVMTGQERYRNNVLYYMNVRRSWYIVSHRYKNDSYGRLALTVCTTITNSSLQNMRLYLKRLNWTMRNKSSISWIAIRPMYMMMNCVST